MGSIWVFVVGIVVGWLVSLFSKEPAFVPLTYGDYPPEPPRVMIAPNPPLPEDDMDFIFFETVYMPIKRIDYFEITKETAPTIEDVWWLRMWVHLADGQARSYDEKYFSWGEAVLRLSSLKERHK